MKALIRLENAALFILSIYLFSRLGFSCWWFPALLFLPDLSMAGYVFGNKTGAVVYNLFHHQGTAVLIYLAGIYTEHDILQLTGIILFAHSVTDRFFGYGLKYFSGFKDTHLGRIGK